MCFTATILRSRCNSDIFKIMTFEGWILLFVFALAIFLWWNQKKKKIATGREASIKNQLTRQLLDGSIYVVGTILGIIFFTLFGWIGLAIIIGLLYFYYHSYRKK